MNDVPIMKSIPCDPDAERACLSCAMQWAESFDQIALHPRSFSIFYHPAHREIWKAMVACKDDGNAMDIVTLTSHLRGIGKLDEVGGAGYVAEIYSDAATPKMLPNYLGIVSDCAKRRLLIQVCHELSGDAFDNSQKIDATIQRLDTEVQSLLRTASVDRMQEWRQVIATGVQLIQDRMQSGGRLPGISTGFDSLDQFTNGYQESQFWVIGARPGSGKTALALNLTENLGRSGTPTAFFSAEMIASQLAIRSLSSQSKLDSLNLARGKVGQSDLQKISNAIHKSLKWPIWIDDRSGMRLIDIQVATRDLVREHGVKVIFVDYLQRLKEPEGSRSREDAVRRISDGLTELAKELKITVIALAQLNRESEKRANKKPSKADLRDSGSIEQDAHVILLLHEEETSHMVVDVDVVVAKCRDGICGDIPFEFSKPTTSFKEKQQ